MTQRKASATSIPTGWTLATVNDVAEYVNGLAFKPTDWEPEGRPIIRIQNLTGQSEHHNRTARPVAPAFVVEPGTILVSWSATLDVFVWRGPQAVLNQHIFKVIPAEQMSDHVFIRWALKNAIGEMWSSEHTHGTTMRHINRGPFLAHRIRLPPKEEQTRIADALESYMSRLDAAVAGLERVQAKLKAYRASVLRAAVEGRLAPTEAELALKEKRTYEPADALLARILKERRRRWEEAELAKLKAAGKTSEDDRWKDKYEEPAPPATSELTDLPDGWCWARTEQLSEFITKGTTPAESDMSGGAGEVPYIKVYNLTFNGSLNFALDPTFVRRAPHAGALARSICFPGDVLMNIVGPPLGKVSIVPSTFPQWNINQAIARYRPLDGLERRYLAYVLLGDRALQWALKRAKTTAGQVNLTLEIARDIPVPLPPFAEQVRIADEIDRLVSVADESRTGMLKEKLRCARLRQAVLKWAFEGKLVDQDPNDESADKLLARIRVGRASTVPIKNTRGRNAMAAT